jgi:peptidoglycan/xylan/chitin deacetylase (PgdA/CDA1 family)
MQIGDHTWNHRAVADDNPLDPANPPVPWATCAGNHFTADECGMWQVQDTSDQIFSAAGIRPAFFRPPFGYYNATTVSDVAALPAPYNLPFALWTTDSKDWTGIPASQIVTNVLDVKQSGFTGVPAGGTILMHDAQQPTVDALPLIVDRLANERGLLPGKLQANTGNWVGPFCGSGGDPCPAPFQPNWSVSAVAP